MTNNDISRANLILTIQRAAKGCSPYWAGTIADELLKRYIITEKADFNKNTLEKLKKEGII